MVILSTGSFPPESAKEVGKRFMEAASQPDYITRRGPFILPLRGEGVQSITIYEVDRPTRIAEAYEFIANEVAKYFSVPGYTYSINVCLEAEEAVKTIGL